MPGVPGSATTAAPNVARPPRLLQRGDVRPWPSWSSWPWWGPTSVSADDREATTTSRPRRAGTAAGSGHGRHRGQAASAERTHERGDPDDAQLGQHDPDIDGDAALEAVGEQQRGGRAADDEQRPGPRSRRARSRARRPARPARPAPSDPTARARPRARHPATSRPPGDGWRGSGSSAASRSRGRHRRAWRRRASRRPAPTPLPGGAQRRARQARPPAAPGASCRTSA